MWKFALNLVPKKSEYLILIQTLDIKVMKLVFFFDQKVLSDGHCNSH